VQRARVLICDDDRGFRSLVRALLSVQDDMEVVGESCDGRACLEQAAHARPDAVLLDLVMPTMSGLAALPQLVAALPAAKIIVLSSEDPAQVEAVVLELGAAGFVAKADRRLIDTLPLRIREALSPAAPPAG
jgi:DNA-binding NarL/FixJ family response regulator